MKRCLFGFALFLIAGGACRGPKFTHAGIELQCSWPRDGTTVCIGGGKTYRCIGPPSGCGVERCGACQVEDQ